MTSAQEKIDVSRVGLAKGAINAHKRMQLVAEVSLLQPRRPPAPILFLKYGVMITCRQKLEGGFGVSS